MPFRPSARYRCEHGVEIDRRIFRHEGQREAEGLRDRLEAFHFDDGELAGIVRGGSEIEAPIREYVVRRCIHNAFLTGFFGFEQPRGVARRSLGRAARPSLPQVPGVRMAVSCVREPQLITMTIAWLGATTEPTILPSLCCVMSPSRTAGAPSSITQTLPSGKATGPIT